MQDILAFSRLALVTLLFGLSILALFRVPVGFLWKPAVFATEWGHLLALVALLLALPGWNSMRGQYETCLAVAAALMLASPMARALFVANALPGLIHEAFGEVDALSGEGAPPLAKPLSMRLGVDSPGVEMQQLTYAKHEGGVQLVADLYRRPLASSPEPQPVAIIIHGGSWNSGDSTQLPGVNRYLAARGVAVAAITYRLSPANVHPAARDDVATAIDFIEEKAESLGLDATRIILMGRSAGGHLALLGGYALKHPAVKGIVAYYPPTDLTWSWNNPANPLVIDSHGSLGEFIGGPLDEHTQAFADASPMTHIDENSPPTLVMHGGRDELVFARQSQRLTEKLRANHVAVIHLELPWATHGFDANMAGPGGQLSLYAVERFVAAVLR